MNSINNHNILITGGTGSFGKKFIDIILKNYNPKKIIIFSRDEQKQYEMNNYYKKFKKILRFFLGDVRDLERLKLALKDVDIVIHAAALKHVESGEYNPFEVVKTNILGTQNVVDAVIETKVKKAIFLSTDKAVSPINLYGSTKLAAEKIFISANNYSIKKFSVIKYGNVFNSRGSVLPFFLSQIKKNEKLSITDPAMTRFNISLEEGVSFVINSLEKMLGGETFIPKMKAISILDLIKVLKPKKGYRVTGVKPGEKLHEELISFSDNSIKIESKNYYIVLPSTYNFIKNSKIIQNIKKKNKGQVLKKCFTYDSSIEKIRLTHAQIKTLVNQNNN